MSIELGKIIQQGIQTLEPKATVVNNVVGNSSQNDTSIHNATQSANFPPELLSLFNFQNQMNAGFMQQGINVNELLNFNPLQMVFNMQTPLFDFNGDGKSTSLYDEAMKIQQSSKQPTQTSETNQDSNKAETTTSTTEENSNIPEGWNLVKTGQDQQILVSKKMQYNNVKRKWEYQYKPYNN